MIDTRCLLQEFHTLVSEYADKLPMTTMYRDSLIRRIEAELQATPPEVVAPEDVRDDIRDILAEGLDDHWRTYPKHMATIARVHTWLSPQLLSTEKK